jgi:hypothetical protein
MHNMENELKIATMIISSDTYPAIRNSKMQKKLFLNGPFNKDLTFWYKAGTQKSLNGDKFKLLKNDLLIDTSDSTLNMGMKTLLALEWLERNCDYDFIVRPTPSSYINYKNLEIFIKTNLLDYKYVYAGKLQNTKDKEKKSIDFISGSTLILNKASVQKVIENKSKWDHSYWDDVALSIIMRELKIEYQNTERFDVTGNPLNQKIPTTYYQYRCRADNHYGYPRYLEALNLNIVHKLSNRQNLNSLSRISLNLFYKISKFFYVYQFGWKSYEFIRKFLKTILPKNIYSGIKRILTNKIENFKNVRFKY